MAQAVFYPDQIRDLRPLALDPEGRIKILPASFWAATTVSERALFGVRTGHYAFPTTELVTHLKQLIGHRTAIEVGAGNGVLAKALEIPATDNKQQLMPKYRAHYEAAQQPIVPYGDNIIEMEANHAVRYYKPDVVIGCWVTHKYDPRDHARGGNEAGLDEPDMLKHCAAYVMIGNDKVHKDKPVWNRQHTVFDLPFIFSRAFAGGRDFLAVFQGLKA